jgi:formyl-CoA transferase
VLAENFAGGTLAAWGSRPLIWSANIPGSWSSHVGVRADGSVGVAPVVRHRGAGRRRPHVDHRVSGHAADARRRSLGDYLQGLFGAIGVLAALNARHRTGRGGRRRVEPGCGVLDPRRLADDLRRDRPPPGARRQPASRDRPYDSYRARDGWVVIALATNRIFRRLAEAMGRPELGTDPRFRGASGRNERSAEINALVGEWVAERTVAEVMDALGPARANVPCSPVYGVDRLVAHPQLGRATCSSHSLHRLGGVLVPGVAVKLSDTPGAVRRSAPTSASTTARSTRGSPGSTPRSSCACAPLP